MTFFLPENVTFFRETTKQTIVCLLISIVDYQYLNKSRAICRSKTIIACNFIVYMHTRHREWWINHFYYQKLILISADFVNIFFYFFHNWDKYKLKFCRIFVNIFFTIFHFFHNSLKIKSLNYYLKIVKVMCIILMHYILVSNQQKWSHRIFIIVYLYIICNYYQERYKEKI